MPTVSIVEIENAHLSEAPHDFRSVTEYKDLPRKTECLPEDENGLYSTDANFPCQKGCGEDAFRYIVEPGDKISLQFQLPDYVNPDPTNPGLGWREADPDNFLLEIEILDLNGNVLWSGNTNAIAREFNVWANESGTFQNIEIDVDDVLDAIGDVDCWYFRVKIKTSLSPDYTAVNAEEPPELPVPIGYTYIDFEGTGHVLEWSGTEWVDQGVPQGIYYVADTTNWYEYLTDPEGWVGIAGHPPPPAEEGFDYVYTMAYRLRRCDEPIVRFRSSLNGRDCVGFNHDPKPIEYIMDPIDGLTFVDYWVDEITDLVDVPIGTTAIYSATQAIMTLTSSGWVLGASLAPGAQVLIFNDGGTYYGDNPGGDPVVAGSVFTFGAWVPLVGYWTLDGALADVFPGEVFVPGYVSSWDFQFDFKVKGSLEIEEYPIETTVTKNGRRIRTVPGVRARVRLAGMPQSVAKLVQTVLSHPTMFVNEEAWAEVDNLRKNNLDGSHWWLDFVLTRDECDVEGSCQ